MSENKTLSILKQVLQSQNIDSSLYSLSGYGDERVCLEKNGSGWDVYVGERGKRYDLTHFSSLLAACMKLIKEVSEDDSEEKALSNSFIMRMTSHVTISIKNTNQLSQASV